jgi:cytoskeleton protein RodZ
MRSEVEFYSFGRYLQSIRLEKKINLEKVAEETRIGLRNLQLIEKEDLERLPAEIFVKGFLRAYAQAIGADGDKAVELYQSRLNMVNKLTGAGSFAGRSAIKLWRDVILSLVGLLVIMILSFYGVSYFQREPHMDEPGEKHEVSQDLNQALPQINKSSGTPKDSKQKLPEKFVLEITALEDTWLKVIVDHKDPNEYNLSLGEHLNLEASTGYNLLIGNAAGLELKLNGKAISIPGKNGEVVNIQLP